MVLVMTGEHIGLFPIRRAEGWSGARRRVLVFVLFNMLLASGMRSLLERLLTRRRVREVLSFFLLMLYVVPRALVQTGTSPKSARP